MEVKVKNVLAEAIMGPDYPLDVLNRVYRPNYHKTGGPPQCSQSGGETEPDFPHRLLCHINSLDIYRSYRLHFRLS